MSLNTSSFTILLTSLTTLLIAYFSSLWMFGKKVSVKGKNCYIAGGSQGLGKDLAILLAQKGAHVVVSARSQVKLDSVLSELQSARVSPDQIFSVVSADISTSDSASKALDHAIEAFKGQSPEFVFCTAGTTTPRLFIDHTPEEFETGFRINYFTALYTVHAATKKMIEQNIKGTIILTSSVLAFMSLIGYSHYSPTKYALRGLADCLRQELAMYGITIQIYFPATIFSPGFEQEQKTKPEITKKIEEADGGLTPRQCAEKLLKGVEKKNYYITSDPIGHLLRANSRGAMPSNNFIIDSLLGFVAWIAMPIWRISVDKMVIKWYKEQGQKQKQKQKTAETDKKKDSNKNY